MARWQAVAEGSIVAALSVALVFAVLPRFRRKNPVQEKRAVFFGSYWGSSKKLAGAVSSAWRIVASSLAHCATENLSDYDEICIVIGTMSGGMPPEEAKAFCQLLEDASFDFRFGAAYLQNLDVCVLGIGDPNYNEHFCVPAKNVAAALQRLGAKVRLALLGPADELDATAIDKARFFTAEVSDDEGSDLENDLDQTLS